MKRGIFLRHLEFLRVQSAVQIFLNKVDYINRQKEGAQEMLLKEAIDLFIVSKKGSTSTRTIEWYCFYLSTLELFFGEKRLSEISYHDLNEWRAWLSTRKTCYKTHPKRKTKQKPLSNSSLRNHIRAVRAFFKWCHHQAIIDSNPAKDLALPRKEEVPPKALSREDVRRLIEAAEASPHWAQRARNVAIVRFLAATGVRREGLISLKLQDVDLDRRIAYVVEKGRKGRWVRFDIKTAAALREYLEVRPTTKSSRFFLNEKGRPLTGNALYQLLKRIAKRAGVQRFNPHAFRHFVATEMARKKASPRHIQQFLGHSDITVTMNYINWVERQELEWYDEFAPIEDL